MRIIFLLLAFVFSGFAVEVKVFTPKKEKITIYYETDGYLVADKKIEVKPEISGIIEEIFVEEGQLVKEDQKLAKIKQTQLNFQLERQKYLIEKQKENLKYLKNIYEKKKFLYKKQLISEDEFLQAKKNYLTALQDLKALETQLNEIKDQLSKAVVISPFDGYLDKKYVNIGDFVSSTTKLFYTYDPKSIILSFYLPQRFLETIKKYKNVNFKLNNKLYDAKIFYISNSLTKNGLIHIKAKPEDLELSYENIYVKVLFPEKIIEGYILPELVVHMKKSKVFVYVVKDKVVKIKPINIVSQKYGKIITDTNFNRDEKIILEAPFDIKEGMKVETNG